MIKQKDKAPDASICNNFDENNPIMVLFSQISHGYDPIMLMMNKTLCSHTIR